MTKMLLATMIVMGTMAANAGGICNPEQEACPVGGAGHVPSWVGKINDWFARHGAQNGGRVCNPEQEACPVGGPGHVPHWVEEMNQWFADHGATPTDPFNDGTGQ